MLNFVIRKFYKAFPAFKYRNYQLFFFGQLVSLIGSWLQIVALGWLVLELTKSAFLVGLSSTISTLPVLFFAIFGGVIVDRFSTRSILIVTQTLLMIFAFILGILTLTGNINIYEIYILAFLSGTVSALDNPARQSFVVEMVGRENLSSAIALNSGIFNGARVIGPAVAGIIIAIFGTGGAFILNGGSFIAVIIALFLMHVKPFIPDMENHPIKAIKEGLHYSYNHPAIKILLAFAAVMSIFAWSYTAIMPYIIQNVFHQGASSLGFFYGATGIGALTGTLVLSIYAKKINPLTFIISGTFLTVIALICFTFTTNYIIAMPFLFLAGLGLILTFATLNTTLQHMVTNEIRGRVMSLYTIAFLGMLPIGSFGYGAITERFGSSVAIRIGAIMVLIFGIILYLKRNQISKSYEEHINRI